MPLQGSHTPRRRSATETTKVTTVMAAQAVSDPGVTRFVLTMFLCYAAFYCAYREVPDEWLRDIVYHYGLVLPSASLIHWLNPVQHVMADLNRLDSSSARLEIVRGCDGSGVLFLLSAALIAFPASRRMRFRGIALGAGVVYLLNLARLVGLYFVAAYHPSWFAPLHSYFIPTLLVVIDSLFFMRWARAASSSIDHGPQQATV